jgi:hypothetical protein
MTAEKGEQEKNEQGVRGVTMDYNHGDPFVGNNKISE